MPFAKKMRAAQPIRLVNPDRTRFNFVGVVDLSGIVRRVIETSVAGSFNVVGDTHPTLREVFQTVRDHFPDYSGKIQVLEDADSVQDVRFANDKLKTSLGIEKLAGYGECLASTFSTMNLAEL